MSKEQFYSTIKDYLQSCSLGGRTTDEISDKYGLTMRQVGGLMGSLKRKGLVHTYTGGTIVLTSWNGTASPMGLSNSFYEWIKEEN